MNRIIDYHELKTKIVSWIKNYAVTNNIESLVVGVSGGIDRTYVGSPVSAQRVDTTAESIPPEIPTTNDLMLCSTA